MLDQNSADRSRSRASIEGFGVLHVRARQDATPCQGSAKTWAVPTVRQHREDLNVYAGDWLSADLRARVTQVEAKPMTSTASANHGARTMGLVTL